MVRIILDSDYLWRLYLSKSALIKTGTIYGTLKITTGLDNNMWFTESGSNKIGKISPENGKVTEYNVPTPNASAYAIAAGPDGNIWFTESGADKIGKISPQSGEITDTTSQLKMLLLMLLLPVLTIIYGY